MIAPRWRKVFHDLWDNKLRSLLVISSIFIGIYSVGLAIALYDVVAEDLNSSWVDTNPSHAELYTSWFQPDLLESLARVEGVKQINGLHSISVQLKIGEDEWIPLTLHTRPEFGDNNLDKVRLVAGTWPPSNRQLVLERSGLPYAKAEIGDVVEIKLPDETIRKIPVVGVVHDIRTQGSVITIDGYVTYDTLEWLHQSPYLDRIAITVTGDHMNKAHVEEVANRVADQLRKSGQDVYLVFVPNPGESPAIENVMPVVAVIGALGSFSVFLAGFLIFNTFSALLAQHIRQIGIMKAIGAHTRQVIGMYMVLILAFSTLALIPAIPLANYSASAISMGMSTQFNYSSLGFRWVPSSITISLLIGLLVPLLAGFFPVMIGARITVHQAINSYGLGQGRFGRNLVDRLVERIRFLSRPILISLRNTFRRKGRLMLTLITLILGGAIFIGVFNLRFSLISFLEQFFKYFQSDVNLTLEQFYPVEKIQQYLVEIPGVAEIEAWTATGGDLLRSDGSAEETVQILAPPAESELIEPIIIQGRWIKPGDENALAVNNGFWRLRPDLQVGDQIRISINEKESTWTIVGFFQFPGNDQLIAYTSYEYLSQAINTPNRSAIYRIVGKDHSPSAQKDLLERVETALLARGIGIADIQPGSTLIEANARIINIIIVFFLFSAIMVAAVGAIGLAGTMSMNVLERIREIGVMRAIGANTRTVLWMVVLEGMLIGGISWVLAAIASIPISNLLYNIMSQAFFRTPGQASFSPDGYLIWLAAAILLSAIASLLPARTAANMTVREVLAYE